MEVKTELCGQVASMFKIQKTKIKVVAFLTFRTVDGGGDDDDGIEEEED